MGLEVNGGSVKTMREEVLHEAANLTGGDRNKTYGSPKPNLDLMGQMEELYELYRKNDFGPAHDAAMSMVFAKLSRIATGQQLHRDNYVDAAAYLAIAYEVAVQAKDES